MQFSFIGRRIIDMDPQVVKLLCIFVAKLID